VERQYENESARASAADRDPDRTGVIYVLLYLTYRSFLDAAQVLLAVPFALAGGSTCSNALGYNFSVAVWVGFNRPLWHRRADRGRDVILPRGGGGPEARGSRADASRARRCSRR